MGNYTYPAASAAHPHAVSSITGTVYGLSNPKFSYDSNGSLTCIYTGASCPGSPPREVLYTPFNMVSEIKASGTSKIDFVYDAYNARVVSHDKTGSPQVDTLYLDDPVTGVKEEYSVAGSTHVVKSYIYFAGRMVGQHTVTNWSSDTFHHYVADHLGSVAVITEEDGANPCRLSYDPWGKRTGSDSCKTTARGFTSHEMIDGLGLVNMNARIYDPIIARFLTPDPMGEAPVSQGLNHYSYVMNNPVSYTDPTGLVLCETRPGEAECVRIPGPGPYGPGQECGVFRDACTILGPEDLAEAVALVRAHHLDIYDFLPNHVCASDNGCVSSMKGNPAPEKPTKGDPKTGSKGPAKDSAQLSKAAPTPAATGTSTVAANGGPDVVSEITITGFLDAADVFEVFGQIDAVAAELDDINMGLAGLMTPRDGSDNRGEQVAADYSSHPSAACVATAAVATGICAATAGAAALCPATGGTCPTVPAGVGACYNLGGAAILVCGLGSVSPANPDRPSDRAIKDQCIQQCYPLLERPRRPGDPWDKNEWDFHNCVNACIGEKKEYWGD